MPKLSPLSARLLQDFPGLTKKNHKVTSRETPLWDYNCIAWAAGHDDAWWWPGASWAFWPANVPATADVSSFQLLFEAEGFVVCTDGKLEKGWEKIAIYALPSGITTHAARQLHSGQWTSKLGRAQDIEHQTEKVIESNRGPNSYGTVQVYMKRAIPQVAALNP